MSAISKPDFGICAFVAIINTVTSLSAADKLNLATTPLIWSVLGLEEEWPMSMLLGCFKTLVGNIRQV